MRNRRTLRRDCGLLMVATVLVAAVAGVAHAALANHADSAGTLQVNSTFANKFFPVACPAGTAAATACHGNTSVRASLSSGLGTVSMSPYTLVLDDFATICTRVHAQIVIAVTGKGEIDIGKELWDLTLTSKPKKPPSVAIMRSLRRV